ncbi:MAG: TerB family tellurite resistance protein [Cyanobacteria bacterium CRU_2_1]|nr:TerB family tellurite resistance protein [Cyanobacteria bacterium RU_5_0]NJR60700.1 TerB family tellurite resistance protein [Cyanobacteria bacterium CRU_2_1]
MVQTPPPPPSISPRQMNLLRAVTAMAWSDGELAEEEVDVMLDRFSGLFAADAQQQQRLRQELQDYMMQNIPLEELIPKLQSNEEKELVLRLGYEVIGSSARTPEEGNINAEEAAAYQKLVDLLGLSSETVQRVMADAKTDLSHDESLVDSLARKLEQFMR